MSNIPCEVVFAPDWWHYHEGIMFDRGFFFDPDRRVRDERRMRAALARRFGDLGLGDADPVDLPVIGPVHLAAGYLLSAALGCEVRYHEDGPPDVVPMNMDDTSFAEWEPPELSQVPVMQEFISMVQALKDMYDHVEGDVNWSGIHNLALDLRGNQLFIDYLDSPDLVHRLFDRIHVFIQDFLWLIESYTGTTSVSVNRSVLHVDPKIHLHSNCSVTMLSPALYSEFVLPYEQKLAKDFAPYGVHHCGNNMHVYADSYAKLPSLAFLDVGWGSDVQLCRSRLPDTFFNLRIGSAELARWTPKEIEMVVTSLACAAAPLDKVGFCCINIDRTVSDEQVRALFAAMDIIG